MDSFVYVDALNIYHGMQREAWPRYLSWVSYVRLARIMLPEDSAVQVKVFTAEATHFPDSLRRQHLWLAAQRSEGAQVVLGNFKRKSQTCRHCGVQWERHEEKETDVNIATHLLRDTYEHPGSLALVLSNDTDLLPAIRMSQDVQPARRIVVASVSQVHVALARQAHQHRRVSAAMMRQALMPAELPGAHSLIRRPDEYTPPPEIRVPAS